VDLLSNETSKIIFIALSALIFMRYLPRIKAKMLGIAFVSIDDVKNRIDSGEPLLVIDVRSAGEFNGNLGHIPGSLNLDAAQLSDKLSQLSDQLEPYKNDPIVVTCRTQNRSPGAARILFQNGFKNLKILNGGLARWNRAEFPVER